MTSKKKSNNENTKVKVINTVPKMADTEREKTKKVIGNELFDIFLRIQYQVNSDSENVEL